MDATTPTRRDAVRSRKAILEAARELMATSEDFPMAEVARRAGVGQATLYRHFSHRAELAATLAAELHDEIVRVVVASGDSPDAFERVMAVLVDCAVASHGITELARTNPVGWRRLEELREALLAVVSGPVDAARAAGRVRPGIRAEDVFLTITMIDGALRGVTDREERRRVAERCLALVLRGVLVDGRTPR